MHIMLDTETLSSANDAAIISIGAVGLDLTNKKVFDMGEDKHTFYREISGKSSQKAGGHVDATTVSWWADQPEEARKLLLSQETVRIEQALEEFGWWLRKVSCEGLWGNGVDFDNVILRAAYERLGETAPWSHKVNRCHRTMRALAPSVKRPDIGVKHHALWDAIAQAYHLVEIHKFLGI